MKHILLILSHIFISQSIPWDFCGHFMPIRTSWSLHINLSGRHLIFAWAQYAIINFWNIYRWWFYHLITKQTVLDFKMLITSLHLQLPSICTHSIRYYLEGQNPYICGRTFSFIMQNWRVFTCMVVFASNIDIGLFSHGVIEEKSFVIKTETSDSVKRKSS